MSSLFRAILDDDGTLEASLAGDNRARARIVRRLYLRAVSHDGTDPHAIRVGLAAVSEMADRLEGRPVAKVEAAVLPQAIFYRAGVGDLGGDAQMIAHGSGRFGTVLFALR